MSYHWHQNAVFRLSQARPCSSLALKHHVIWRSCASIEIWLDETCWCRQAIGVKINACQISRCFLESGYTSTIRHLYLWYLIRRYSETAPYVMLFQLCPHTRLGVRYDTIRYGRSPILAERKNQFQNQSSKPNNQIRLWRGILFIATLQVFHYGKRAAIGITKRKLNYCTYETSGNTWYNVSLMNHKYRTNQYPNLKID